jgi:hypothetical protein
MYKYTRLLSTLLKRRPELKGFLGTHKDRAHTFLTRQLHHMRKGYTEDVAFSKTEEEQAKNLAEVRSHSAMQYAIGTSTAARSFMNYYQQVAEYEGRLKVKRIVKDLPKYLRSSKEFDIFQGREYINQWENLTVGVASSELRKNDTQKTFIAKAEHLVEVHKEKANKFDGLQGLSDSMILWSARDAYRHLKKHSGQILSELEEMGVKLKENGELDESAVKSEDLREALKKNPVLPVIFQNAFPEKYPDEELPKEVDGEVRPGDLSPPEIKWTSENPYKQVYGRLQPSQVESQEERIERLKRLWHNARKKNTAEEQFKLQQEAVKALRSVRMKVDQLLVDDNKPAVFSVHASYSKEELLLTHRLDVERMSRFLAADPAKLAETEAEKREYEEVLKMTRQETIVEGTEPVGFHTLACGTALLRTKTLTAICLTLCI